MFRLRRSRVLLACAVVITVLLYHVYKNSAQWDHSPEIWRAKTAPQAGAPQAQPKPAHDRDHDHEKRPGDTRPQKPSHDPRPPPPPPDAAAAAADDEPSPTQGAPTIRIPELKTSDGVKGGYSLPTKVPSVPEAQLPSGHEEHGKQIGDEGIHFVDPPAKHQADVIATATTVHWTKPSEWFPVPEESLILLPTGKPKTIPSVQFAFADESPAAKAKREQRLAKVKEEAVHAWSGYKKYAWTHDELTPVSNGTKDPFCGWAATLVDALDTLWIMGLKDEFEDAVEAVKEIDFTTTPYRDEIPVFETTIRYLGGLLGAYDVAGGHDSKYRVLLDKAVELAEILMGVFDTPNRMPVLYYNWKPDFTVNPKRASTGAGVAELGTLSMEFTRLAQLTGKNKYYDAVARITDALEDLQNRENGTAIPGIFPEHLDASGCNRSAPLPSTLEISSEAAQNQANDDPQRASIEYDTGNNSSPDANEGDHGVQSGAGSHSGFHRGPRKRDGRPTTAPTPFTAKGLPADWDCVAQNLTAGGWGPGQYSMGGNQDSAYEYFPKQYVLLGGLVPKYRAMHEKVAEAVKKYLLFRPMAEGDPDILFSAKVLSSDGTAEKLTYDYEVTHLTCFLGGMFALGGKLFDRPEDVEVGKKLTDGCVWAYEVMPTGIMPEYAKAMPCKSQHDCHFDQAAWYEALDPNKEQREKEMEEYHAKTAEWQHQVDDLKTRQAEERNPRLTGGDESASPPDATGSPTKELVLPPKPQKPLTHEEFVSQQIQEQHLPSGFVSLNDKRYILR
jgi:mannosyl-oligosaccharide alpha-1,2-mannosidase